MITVGGRLANLSARASPPRMLTSSSLTNLMICCDGLSALDSSASSAAS